MPRSLAVPISRPRPPARVPRNDFPRNPNSSTQRPSQPRGTNNALPAFARFRACLKTYLVPSPHRGKGRVGEQIRLINNVQGGENLTDVFRHTLIRSPACELLRAVCKAGSHLWFRLSLLGNIAPATGFFYEAVLAGRLGRLIRKELCLAFLPPTIHTWLDAAPLPDDGMPPKHGRKYQRSPCWSRPPCGTGASCAGGCIAHP